MEWSFSTHTSMRRCQRAFVFGHIMVAYNAHGEANEEAALYETEEVEEMEEYRWR